jgi:hypothetical protein
MERVEEFVSGKQNYNKGLSSSVGAEVFNISFSNDVFCGVVHSEKTGNKHYQMTVTLGSTWKSSCTCKANTNKHNKCKHVAALLSSLYHLKNHCSSPPKAFVQRMKAMASVGVSPVLGDVCGKSITWDQVLLQYTSPPPSHNNKPAIIISEPVKRKKRRGKVYCLCKGKKEKGMVKCSKCSDFFHLSCLSKFSISVGKKKDFICPLKCKQ